MRKLLTFFLALAAIVTPVFAEPSRTKIPVEDFAALPALTDPILSPDGHWIAARRVGGGQSQIIILDANRPDEVARAIAVGSGRISDVKWAGSGRLLLTVLQFARGDRLPFLRLTAVDLGSGASRVLDPNSQGAYAGAVLSTDPNGSWALVASQDDASTYPSVKRVDLETGRATLVEKARHGVWDWYADDNGVVRAGVAYSDRRWTVWYRDRPEENLRRVEGKLDTSDDSAVDKFVFRGPTSWIVTNERTGRFGLYKYDVPRGAIGEAIFEHPHVDLGDVLYDSASGVIRAISYEDDRPRIQWLDPDMKALQPNLDRALPNTVNLPIGWSQDEKTVLVRSTGASNPERYFILDRARRQMHAVVDPYPNINPALLADVKSVTYQSRDGLTIHAYLTLPRERIAKGLPLILMPHGGPFDRDHWEYDPLVQFLANRGYAVLQPEYRGSTGYGKEFVSKGFGEWGRKMQDDLNDGLDWLAGTGQIDPRRVCIVGSSYGGYAALWGSIRDPDRYRCAASMAGVADVSAMLRKDQRLFTATRYYKDWRNKVAGVDADLNAISPINFAKSARVPLFIAHGERDERVPVQQSRAMVNALTRAGVPVVSSFYRNSGHGFDTSEEFAAWLTQLEQFLAAHNPA